MAGSRPLTPNEERRLVQNARRFAPRDRVLVLTGLFGGWRISEALSLTIGQVYRAGRIAELVGVRPAKLKGQYGVTRWIPVCPELKRALADYIVVRQKTAGFNPDAPLFLSRERPTGVAKALSRSAAEKLLRRVLREVAQGDAQRLSTHSLRKTWARRLYEQSGHDLLLVRDGLGHSSVAVTQRYLECDRDRLEHLILAGDWTRAPSSTRDAVPDAR